MSIAIIGNGGLGREIKSYLNRMGIHPIVFVSDEFYRESDNVFRLSEFNPITHYALICIADVSTKKRISKQLPSETKYYTFIHPSAQLYTNHPIGDGSIICPNVVVTTDVKIGNHVLLNVNTTVGHDSEIGNYCTINPNSAVAGNCKIEDSVFIGSSSAIKEKLNITSESIIGMGSIVIKDISEKGTYVGLPAKRIK